MFASKKWDIKSFDGIILFIDQNTNNNFIIFIFCINILLTFIIDHW